MISASESSVPRGLADAPSSSSLLTTGERGAKRLVAWLVGDDEADGTCGECDGAFASLNGSRKPFDKSGGGRRVVASRWSLAGPV